MSSSPPSSSLPAKASACARGRPRCSTALRSPSDRTTRSVWPGRSAPGSSWSSGRGGGRRPGGGRPRGRGDLRGAEGAPRHRPRRAAGPEAACDDRGRDPRAAGRHAALSETTLERLVRASSCDRRGGHRADRGARATARATAACSGEGGRRSAHRRAPRRHRRRSSRSARSTPASTASTRDASGPRSASVTPGERAGRVLPHRRDRASSARAGGRVEAVIAERSRARALGVNDRKQLAAGRRHPCAGASSTG